MKYLVLMGNAEPTDFRKKLLDEYKKKYSLTSNSINVVGDKVAFGNLYLDPDKVMIMNGTLNSYNYAEDCYLSSMGYTVDDIPVVNKICENKFLLFKMLRDMDAPVQQCFSKPIKDQRYNIMYSTGKCSVEDSGFINNVDGKTFQPWHEDVVKGYTLFYYLYHPVIVAKTIYRNPYYYAHLSQIPEGLFTTNSMANGLKKQLEDMPGISNGFLDQISKIMYRLQVVSGEIILGWSEGGLKIIDISPTHFPMLARFTTIDIANETIKRFKEYMGIE
jgi:hypothetical protein